MKKLTALMILACVLVGMVGCSRTPAATIQDENKTLAPDVTVYDAEGKAYKLSDFRGKPVVLNFWASWCGPCKAEMPDFQKEYEVQGDQVQFLILNLTDGVQETVDSASAYIAQQGYTFPVYYDRAASAAATYGVQSIPSTFFVDAQGYIVAQVTGMLSREGLQQGISLILDKD